MIYWLWILGGIYVGALVLATLGARGKNSSADEFMMTGSDLGIVVGCLTVAATLFSTFTLLGMPDFFRTHGVGAWIFLGVSDAVLAFMLIWVGTHLRRRAAEREFRGIAGMMCELYGTRWAGYLYLIGVFIFLIPYVAIQIRGVGIFMEAIFPGFIPVWGWALLIVVTLLIYSSLGGLQAIVYADAIQGTIMLTVVLVIAYGCIAHFGSLQDMFESVRLTSHSLLSVPGPKGLFTAQFLFASFLGLILMPVTQPQMITRVIIMKDQRSLNRMAVMLGFFAMLLVLAILPIGMYGAVEYADASTSQFLSSVLIYDQPPLLGAAAIIGLIAAAISTSDSQLFALGNEVRSLLSGPEITIMRKTKVTIITFAAASLVVAILANDQLVLLARVSLVGTALMAPFILAGLLTSRAQGVEIILVSACCLLVFLVSLLGFLPDMVGSIRLDLLLMMVASGVTALSVFVRANLEVIKSHPIWLVLRFKSGKFRKS